MKKIYFLILTLALLVPVVSKAQEYKLLEPLPCIEGTSTGGKCVTTEKLDFSQYVGYVFKFSIALAAFLAVIMIIWGGVQYMTSEVPFLKLEGKNKIGGAIAGLVMILASYLILATIDPRLVEINTSIPQLNIDTSEIGRFKNDIYNELDNIGLEAIRENAALNTKILSDQQKLAGLDSEINNNGDMLTPEEKEALIVERTKLDQSIKASESKKIDVATNAYVNTIFKNTLDIFHNSISYENSTLVFSTGASVQINNIAAAKVNEAREEIINYFDGSIKKLREMNDTATIQKLTKDRNFYLDQINKEQEANELINRYVLYKGGTVAELEQAVKTYQEQLKGVVAATTDPTMANKYTLILQDRINRTSSYIKK